MKATTGYFSHRYFARRAGFHSPNFLKNVMEGRKNLSKESVLRFARGLGLSARETEYFENMVFFDQSETTERKQHYYQRMQLFSRSIVRQLVSGDQSAYFSKWYHCVVRELVVIRNYQDDWVRLARDVRPALTPAVARKSVELLVELGLIRREPDGTYAQSARNLTLADSPAAVVWVRQHHRDSLHNAIAAIDEVPPGQRSATSVVMSISEETYRAIEAELQEFRNRVSLIANTSAGADRVYQLAMQLFPVSSIPRGRRP
jgi:uncharacterized protein (TIGR02147 family)